MQKPVKCSLRKHVDSFMKNSSQGSLAFLLNKPEIYSFFNETAENLAILDMFY